MKLRRTDAVVYGADRKSSNSKAFPLINTENSQTDVKITPRHFRHSSQAGPSFSRAFQLESLTWNFVGFHIRTFPILFFHELVLLSVQYVFQTSFVEESYTIQSYAGTHDRREMMSYVVMNFGGN